MASDPVREYLSQLGKRGAAATNKKLTPEQRQKNAQKAIKARWAKHDKTMEKTGKQLEKTLAAAEALLKVAKGGTRRAKKRAKA